MKKLAFLPLLMVILLLPMSCNPVAVKSVSELASLGLKVVNILKGCSDLSDIFSSKVSLINKGMEDGIKADRTTLELAKYWEKYWGDVRSYYNDLNYKLVEANNVSQQYFAELHKNNIQISNTDLKEKDMKRTVEIKERYEIEYAEAVKSLEKAREILKEGNDILLVLRNNVLTSALENQITVLKNITVESEIFTQKIKTFSSNCIPFFTENQ